MHCEKFKELLESSIQKLEKVSSVEIVPVWVKRSAQYTGFRRYYSLLFSIFLYFIYHYFFAWQTVLVDFVVFLGLLVFFELFFYFFKKPLTALLPNKVKQRRALTKAKDLFLRQEVFLTRERTGILIFVSELEKEVLVLADSGFSEKIESSFWSQLGIDLAQEFNRDDPGKSILKAIESVQETLVKNFPVRSDDSNELSNKLIDE